MKLLTYPGQLRSGYFYEGLNMCEFCDGREKRIENGFTYGNAHIAKTNFGYTYSLRYDNSANEYGEGEFEINYCPICGRKLVEE